MLPGSISLQATTATFQLQVLNAAIEYLTILFEYAYLGHRIYQTFRKETFRKAVGHKIGREHACPSPPLTNTTKVTCC